MPFVVLCEPLAPITTDDLERAVEKAVIRAETPLIKNRVVELMEEEPIDNELDFAARILERAGTSLVCSSLEQAVDLAAEYRAAGFYFVIIARDTEALLGVFVGGAWRYAEPGLSFGKTSPYAGVERFSTVPALPPPQQVIDTHAAAARAEAAAELAVEAAQAAQAAMQAAIMMTSAPPPPAAPPARSKVPTFVWVLLGLGAVVVAVAAMQAAAAPEPPPPPPRPERRRKRRAGRRR